MKRLLKTFILVVLSVLMCVSGFPISVAAEENQITPRLSHIAGASFAFAADASGGYIDASYTGYSSKFVRAVLTVKVEKRFLLAFWNDVGTWSATSTAIDGYFTHVMSLNGSGTYRATFTLEVIGRDGTVDVVEVVRESSY